MNKMLLIQPGAFLKKIYPGALWNFNRSEKNIYLTFDDGPVPGLTDWILEVLEKFNAKATFFCVGANVLKHPDLFNKVKEAGHTVANHTMFHTKGLGTSVEQYLRETEECRALVGNNLFRPPYGKIKRSQFRELMARGYRVVLWDVISYDYEKIEPRECAVKVIRNCRPGSIVLFHDNIKAEHNMKYALPLMLKYFSEKGFRFRAIVS